MFLSFGLVAFLDANVSPEVMKQTRLFHTSVEWISRDKLAHGERVLRLDAFDVGQWDFLTRAGAV